MNKKMLILIIVIIAILVVFGILIIKASPANIYTSTAEITEPLSDVMSSEEVKMFNSGFESYLGTRTAPEIKVLIATINASNINDGRHYVKCDFNISDIDKTKTYTVSAEYDNNGYISSIIIK